MPTSWGWKNQRFSLFEVGTRTVHPDGHVQVAGAFYSVPHTLVGEEVRIHWDDRLVRVYAHGQCVAVHTRAPAGTFATRGEHRPIHKPARQAAYEATLLAQAEHIGPQALGPGPGQPLKSEASGPTVSSRAWSPSPAATPGSGWTGLIVPLPPVLVSTFASSSVVKISTLSH